MNQFIFLFSLKSINLINPAYLKKQSILPITLFMQTPPFKSATSNPVGSSADTNGR